MTRSLRPTAYVLNLYGTGLGIARNLGRHGISVVGVSSQTQTPGAPSRYSRHLVGPDSETEPDRLLAFLRDQTDEATSPAVLFPSRDHDIFFVERFRDRLAERFVFSQPSGEALDRIMDKDRLAAHARSVGIGSPRSWKVRSEVDLERISREVAFPAVLKPVVAARWRRAGAWEAAGQRKGTRVSRSADLLEAYRRIAAHEAEALVQEWVPGAEDQFYVYGTYFDRQGRHVAGFTARKLLQYPPEFGLGCLVRSAQDSDVETLSVRLLESLDFRGIAEVEWKRNASTGELSLIEINPRHWDQHELGTRCGVNLTYLAYRDLCGMDPIAVRKTGRASYWIGEQGIWGALKDDVKHHRARTLRLLTSALFAPKVFALWSWRDPAPAWRSLFPRGKVRRVAPDSMPGPARG